MSCQKKPFYLAVQEDALDSCYKQHATEAAAVKEAEGFVEEGESPVFVVKVVGIVKELSRSTYCPLGKK